MASSLHPSEMDSGATDSVASSPRSDHASTHDPRVRFMCSFGGKIIPRPHDNQLRYVGGDTRIVAVHRSATFSALLTKLAKLSGIANMTVKYQLPNEDLDALISVTTDEDVENMMEEYDRSSHNQTPRSARLRLFLFSPGEDSRASSISSLLDGSVNREHWFFDALNSGPRLERGRSEASSIVSEVPDCLFGLDNSDETQVPREMKPKTRPVLHDNVYAADPGSPAPVVSSPFYSTSSMVPIVPSIPDLPPIKTKPDNTDSITQPKQNPAEEFSETVEPPTTQPTGYSNNPAIYPSNSVVHYVPDPRYSGPPVQEQPVPIYYVQGPVSKGTIPVQSIQIRPHYIQQYPMPTGHIPVGCQHLVPGMGQAYGGPGLRPLTTLEPNDARTMVPEGVAQQVYYGVRNPSAGPGPIPVPGYRGVMMPGHEDSPKPGPDPRLGRASQQ